MLIFNTEQRPHTTPQHLAEGDKEGYQAGVLCIIRINGVEYPVETNDGVDDHGSIVPPYVFET